MCAVCFEPIAHTEGLFEFLFCDDDLCSPCRHRLPLQFRRFRLDKGHVWGMYRYEGEVRQRILQYKEHNDEYLARIFMKRCRNMLRFRYSGYQIVCVPSTETAFQERGFDATATMAAFSGLPILQGVLVNTSCKPQKHKSREERSEIQKFIQLKDVSAIQGKCILLFDDVMTTGSTLRSCARILLPHCKNLKALVCAYHPFS